jgi:hypothetical protein
MGALLGVMIFIGAFGFIASVVFGIDFLIDYYERVFGE